MHIGQQPGGVADRPAFTDRRACAFGLPDFVAVIGTPSPSGRGLHPLGRPVEVTGRQEYAGAQPNGWNIARDVSADAAGHRNGTGTAAPPSCGSCSLSEDPPRPPTAPLDDPSGPLVPADMGQ
ncbi:hypothetical protein PV367_46595 [Streptomyces europaeiscabiei]|uniref:Uncharacterized protein n=1 Tax=Streptomyces europaeiscabiei TaxID=146819 RepID=A0AAJ2USE1_9ACTN|nr:hypothetical protein [Streptomyces europaeiscabiei]MDX3137099.1 hypothetical protein [Streptomyces europaeiscabiei]